MARMEQPVVDALMKELNPTRMPIPGAGAIPAGPGAAPNAPPPVATLGISPQAWCVHLDHALDAKAAGSNAASGAFAFVAVLPLFALGVLAVAASKGSAES